MITVIVTAVTAMSIGVAMVLVWWLGWLGGLGVALGLLAAVVALHRWVLEPWHIRRGATARRAAVARFKRMQVRIQVWAIGAGGTWDACGVWRIDDCGVR